jgi:Protein of unknown function (DUF1499)
MRILVRTSRLAIWARRIASFTVPLVVLPVFMHREGLITAVMFQSLELTAAGLALLGAVLGVIAMLRLWISGDRGWDRAVWGLLLSLVCLAPFAYVALQVVRYPLVLDVATDDRDALPLVVAAPPAPTSVDAILAVAAAFPNIKSRVYPLNAQQTFEIVTALVAERGWDVRQTRAPASVLGEGQINALTTTLLGWRHEVALRVRGNPDGAAVDMRSVSLDPVHDLGANGQYIEEFLVALDSEVTLLMRDNPAAVQPLDGSVEEPAEPVEEAAEEGG